MAQPAEIESSIALKRFSRRWRQRIRWRRFLHALAAALAILFVLWFWLPALSAVLVALAAGLGAWLLLAWQRPAAVYNPQAIAIWLDQQYPQLQYSSSLLLQQPDGLSLPAKVQQQRIANKLAPMLATQKVPVPLVPSIGLVVLVLGAGLLMRQLWEPGAHSTEPFYADTPLITSDTTRAQLASIKRDLPELTEARIRLAPPAYTRQAARFYELSDLTAPESSRLTWQMKFKGGVRKVFLTNEQNDTLHFSRTSQGDWVAQLSPRKPLFYRIGYATATDTAFSAYLKISIQADTPPQLRILEPEQYQLEQQGSPFSVLIEATDDYGLEDVFLSLTMSRGSGEQVSFREDKVWIAVAKGAKTVQKRLQLSPKALGMQPGDELYFRLEAIDNKPPRGQQSRSNSWYYQWQDTAAVATMLSSGMAMPVEPEYFRSQRQIIIDTEKLISTQRSTPVAKWEKANQDLGVDQKLLRLRYGKFLGEEFESTAGGVLPEQEEGEDDHSGHDHPEGEDHEEASPQPDLHHDHDHEQAGQEVAPGTEQATALLEMFGHAHDTEEGATFYEESVKVKLKAALAEMWEAEKFLRLSQPRQALPYEYRALRIIKEVQQSTRIYVERVGLELPPLIPQEYRLQGEQDKILPQNRQHQQSVVDTLAATRQLLARLSYWEKGEALGAREQELLRQTGKEVARLLIAGGPYLEHFYLLNSLTSLQETPVPQAAAVRKLQQGLLQLLPEQHAPAAKTRLLGDHQKNFLEQLSLPAGE